MAENLTDLFVVWRLHERETMTHRLFLVLVLVGGLTACSDMIDIDMFPGGPVARNASEAFPAAPEGVPVLSRQAILSACVRAQECQVGQPLDDGTPILPEHVLLFVEICEGALTSSAERAIPVSDWFIKWAQTADLWVACVEGATTCEGVRACDIKRDGVSCEEAGCFGPAGWKETRCQGTVATLVAEGGEFVRDCALAHASCDPASPTGCTDRHSTSCPEDLDKADRCDGDVRLGCDRFNRVSYRDCRRMGGTCGKTPEGRMDCIYPGTSEACAAEPPLECQGGKLSLCVLGGLVEQPTTLCP